MQPPLCCLVAACLSLLVLVALQGCLDGMDSGGSDRRQDLLEMTDLVDVTYKKAGFSQELRKAVRARLLGPSLDLGSDASATGRAVLKESLVSALDEGAPRDPMPELGALLSLRLARLAQLQAESEDKGGAFGDVFGLTGGVSAESLSQEFSGEALRVLFGRDFTVGQLLVTVRVVYAGLSLHKNSAAEKRLLESMLTVFLRSVQESRPEDAERFVADSIFRESLKQTFIGNGQVEQILGGVLDGAVDVLVLQNLIEKLTPADTIITSAPADRSSVLQDQIKTGKSVITETSVVFENERQGVSKESSLIPDEADLGGGVVSSAGVQLDAPEEVSVAPSALFIGSVPECVVSPAAPAGGRVVYSWRLNETELTEETDRFFYTDFNKGDGLSCAARFVDNQGGQSASVESLINEVRNSPPNPGTALLRPAPPEVFRVGSAATCLKSRSSDFTDNDGDAVTLSYTWLIDGEVLDGYASSSLANLPGEDAYFRKGQTIQCSITGRDKADSSPPSTAVQVITVANTPPTLGGVGTDAGGDGQLRVDESVRCNAAGAADVDGDALSIFYRWFVNGAEVPGATTDILTAGSLPNRVYERGDKVRCRARAFDGTEESVEVSGLDVTVVNSAPDFIGPVTVSPAAPTMFNDLTCSYTPGTDRDGDTLTYSFEWFVNGAVRNNSSVVSAATSSTLKSTGFAPGDSIFCRVRAHDGHTTGGVPQDSASVVPTGFAQLSRYGGSVMGVTGDAATSTVFVAKGLAGVEIYDRNAGTGHVSFVSGLYLGKSVEKVFSRGQHLFAIGTTTAANVNDSLYVIDVSDRAAPELVADYTGASDAKDLELFGDIGFLANGNGDLQVLDLSDLTAPRLCHTVDPGLGQAVWDAKVSGSSLYVANGLAGVVVYDLTGVTITDTAGVCSSGLPRSPTTGGYLHYVDTNDARALTIDGAGSRVYVADWNLGLRMMSMEAVPSVNTSVPSAPGNAAEVHRDGSLLFVSNSNDGWSIAQSDGSSLTKLSTTATEGRVDDIWTLGNTAYVANAGNGLLVFDVSVAASPVLVQHLDAVANALKSARSGNHLFIADDTNGLVVMDVTDSRAPLFVTSRTLPAGKALDVLVNGNALYVAADTAGLYVYDVSDPTTPSGPTLVATPYRSYGLALHGDLLAVADGSGGARLLDVSDPLAPVDAATPRIDTPGTAYGVALVEITTAVPTLHTYLFVADGSSGLVAYDVTNLAAPVSRGTFQEAGVDLRAVTIAEGRAIVSALEDGVYFLDITSTLDPAQTTGTAPVRAAVVATLGKAYEAVYRDGFVYIATGKNETSTLPRSGCEVINATDIGAPSWQHIVDTVGSARGLAFDGSTVFLADGANGLVVMGQP